MVGYNPNGREGPDVAGRDEGFLFWLAWLHHNGAALFSSSDANGPFRPVTLGGDVHDAQAATGEQPAARMILCQPALLDTAGLPGS